MSIRKEKIRQIFEEINDLRRDDYAYYDLKRNVSAILEELNGLIAEESDEEKKIWYRQTFLELAHTDTKEVEFVKHYEDSMRKKNAAKIRRTEYFEAVEKAYNQIYMDLILMLKE